MCGTAAAASSRSTVMRPISDPARASAATCLAVPSISAVSVLVIDCTTTGAPPPTVTFPTFTATVRCLSAAPEYSPILAGCLWSGLRRAGLCGPKTGGTGPLDIASPGPVDEEETPRDQSDRQHKSR